MAPATYSDPATSQARPAGLRVNWVVWVHVSLSAMWGIGLLIGMLISLGILFSLAVDVANGVNTVVSLGFTALLMAATVVVAKRARAKGQLLREQTGARQG